MSNVWKDPWATIVVPSSVRSTVSVDPLAVGSVSNGRSGSSQMLRPMKLKSPAVLDSKDAEINPSSIGKSQPMKTYWSWPFETRSALTTDGSNTTSIRPLAKAA